MDTDDEDVVDVDEPNQTAAAAESEDDAEEVDADLENDVDSADEQ